MTIDEHNNVISAILQACDNNTQVQTLALQLQDDYKTITAEHETTIKQLETTTTERDKYAKLNNELWLRQTGSNKETNRNNNNNEDDIPTKREYSDLNFD